MSGKTIFVNLKKGGNKEALKIEKKIIKRLILIVLRRPKKSRKGLCMA